MIETHNKRVVGLVSRCSLPEPFGSGFGLFVYGWNHSDSAAHAKHYAQNTKIIKGEYYVKN